VSFFLKPVCVLHVLFVYSGVCDSVLDALVLAAELMAETLKA
jgi:hypothetical protein